MIQHISIRHKSISFDSFNLDTENATANHHPDLTVLFQWELRKFRHFSTDQIIVSLDVLDFLRDLILEWAPIKPEPFFHSVENWEVIESFR